MAGLRDGLARGKTGHQDILVAVSGGRDSMAMLHGIHELNKEIETCRIVVAHLNHGLRGSESDDDARLVERFCERIGIPCVIETLASNELKGRARGSLEESARIARYEFLQRTAQSERLPVIVTAHHQQDQVETILFSLLRGTGLRGLSGMPESRSLSGNVQVARPLLRIDRQAILEYVHDSAVEFREDSSNRSCEFARNRIRQLMTALPEVASERMATQLLELGDQARSMISTVDLIAARILAAAILEQSASGVRLDRRKLQSWPEPLVRNAFIVLWMRRNWPRQQMNTDQWHRLSGAVFSGKPKGWSLPGGVQLSVRKTTLSLTLTSNAVASVE